MRKPIEWQGERSDWFSDASEKRGASTLLRSVAEQASGVEASERKRGMSARYPLCATIPPGALP